MQNKRGNAAAGGNKNPHGDEVRKKIVAFKQAFGTESGAAALKDLEGYCGYNRSSYIRTEGMAVDPLEMAFLEGKRDVLIHIKRILDLELTPE